MYSKYVSTGTGHALWDPALRSIPRLLPDADVLHVPGRRTGGDRSALRHKHINLALSNAMVAGYIGAGTENS